MPDTILEQPVKTGRTRSSFEPGLWSRDINVRDFIQQNVTPYDGDEAFLAGPTERTTAIWDQLQALFLKEREKGGSSTSPRSRPRSWRTRRATSTGTGR